MEEMGLAPGGRMRQEIYDDPYGLQDWETGATNRCFVHLCNSLVWQAVTGVHPPHPPPTAAQYTAEGFPWFDYYDEGNMALDGSQRLAGLKSVAQKGAERGDVPLPENEPVTPENVVALRRKLAPEQVREGEF